MPSPRSAVCWPNQFLAKWFAVFFGAFAIGIILSASRHRPQPAQLVQAHVKVQLQLGPGAAPQPVAADISILDHPGDPWKRTAIFSENARGDLLRRLIGGQQQFLKVWPKNAQGQHEGDPVDWTVTWPTKAQEGETLTETVVRSYAVPNWHP